MKKSIFAVIAIIALTLVAFKPGPESEEKYPSIKLGTEMPMKDYKMKDVSGKSLSLKDVKKENGTLVIFSCNTCPFVIQWEDRYPMAQNIASAVNVGVVLVNSNEAKRTGEDSFEAMVEHAKKAEYTMPYVVDEKSELANAFGAKTTPHVYLFDANDKLVYVGAIDDNSRSASEVKNNYLFTALKELASGKGIKTAQTDAKGCSIKRVN